VQISVIIPAYQAREYLGRCLQLLAASTYRPHEIIVVDDGSTDGTVDLARDAGATVIRVADGPAGPAVARNQGAAAAAGDVLLFLDADVAVHPTTLEQIAALLAANPDVAAVFGSYDDRPAAGTFVSRYRNLLHHFVHQHGRREASTFWAGCGAIRRKVFESVGGFDETFRRASIEDIELGGRLRHHGHRVWLCREVLVRHLKRWTFRSVLRSDIRDRAIPWTHLILDCGRLPSDLNTALRSRMSAAAAWGLVAILPLALISRRMLLVPAVSLVSLLVLNRRLYRLFFGRGGIRFFLTAVGMHVLYLLYSSAVFAAIVASRRGLRRPRERVSGRSLDSAA
jgi:glycosyltransferase involved in cell wall biosynthesis